MGGDTFVWIKSERLNLQIHSGRRAALLLEARDLVGSQIEPDRHGQRQLIRVMLQKALVLEEKGQLHDLTEPLDYVAHDAVPRFGLEPNSRGSRQLAGRPGALPLLLEQVAELI